VTTASSPASGSSRRGVGGTPSLALNIEIKFREYATYSLFNGSDQFLDLGYSELLRRYLTLNLNEIAGTTANPNGASLICLLSNTNVLALPTSELFNNRTNYAKSRVDLVWQRSPRLTFDFGGDGFVVRRENLALAGLEGYSAHAAVA
jgi:hypothetical protein